ncbi:hypothetical protein LAZ67_8001121, partial [Cordylochernes scorpioides]
MAEIETYYKNKVRIGLAINLPKSAIVQALSNGVPRYYGNLLKMAQPSEPEEWLCLAQQLTYELDNTSTKAAQQRSPRQSRAPSTTVDKTPPYPCPYCGGQHWNAQCQQRGPYQRTFRTFIPAVHNVEQHQRSTRPAGVYETAATTSSGETNPCSSRELMIKEFIEQRPELPIPYKQLLYSFEDIFPINKFNVLPLNITPVKLKIISDKVISLRPYRTPYAYQKEIQDQVSQLLKHDIITPSSSPYSSPVTLVRKRDNTMRLCIDFRRVNELVPSDLNPLPLIETALDNLSKARVFSTVDISNIYYQIPIAEESQALLSFVTQQGQYNFKRLPFGFRSAPQIFERVITQLIHKHHLSFIAHYYDDFVIFSDSSEQYLTHLRLFFKFCLEENLQLNLEKCNFYQNEIYFLGYHITAGTYTPNIKNTEIINAIRTPINIKTLQSFLGAVNVYHKFIPEYARLRHLLNQLLKKNAKWLCSPNCQQAFDKLKQHLATQPVLHLFQEGLPCQVYCDATTQGIAGVLKQVHPDGNIYPVQYYSRALRSYERNHTISELECLAIVECVDKFRVYLLGTRFVIYSDHHALQWRKTIKDPTGSLFRWSLRLSAYDYEVKYLKGSRQYEADLLSRNLFCGFLSTGQIKDHQGELRRDTRYILNDKELMTITRRGVTKINVPPSLRGTLLQRAHRDFNHPGISQMTSLIAAQYYWDGITNDIRKHSILRKRIRKATVGDSDRGTGTNRTSRTGANGTNSTNRASRTNEQERKEQMVMEFELEKLRIQTMHGNIDPSRGTSNNAHCEIRKLMPKYESKDSDLSFYLILFERQAKRLGLDEDQWAFSLLGLLPYEMTQLIARETEEQSGDYRFVKRLLLKRYKLSPEQFRQKFEKHDKSQKGSWRDFAFELRGFFNEWIEGMNVENFDALKDLSVTNQLKKKVPNVLRNHLIDDWTKINNPDVLADKLDEYENVRAEMEPPHWNSKHTISPSFQQKSARFPKRSEVKETEQGTNVSSREAARNEINEKYPNTTRRMVNRAIRNDKGEPKCFNCNQFGHIARDCPVPKATLACRGCCQTGHKERNCKRPKEGLKVANLEVEGLKSAPPDVYLKDAKIDNKETVKAMIDTGSSSCLLRESVARRINVDIEPDSTSLYGIGNQTAPAARTVGKTTVDLEIDGVVGKEIAVFIVNDDAQPYELLIGRTWTDLPYVSFARIDKELHIGYSTEFPFANLQEEIKSRRVELRATETFQLGSDCINFASAITDEVRDGYVLFTGVDDCVNSLLEVVDGMTTVPIISIGKGNLRVKKNQCIGRVELLSPDDIVVNLDVSEHSFQPKSEEMREGQDQMKRKRPILPEDDFARKAEPLSRLTKKGTQFEWKEEQRRSFGGLRNDLVEYPVLAHYNPELKTEVHCDASAEGLAGMLLQDDEDYKWRLVYCVSKNTTEAEKMYDSSKLELMAIVWTLERLRQFLVGIKFTVVTDCQALVYMNAKNTNPQIARWYNLIQEYDFDIRHKPGEKMAHVDIMSRAPVDDPRDTMEEIVEKNLEVCFTITLEEQIMMIQHYDPELRALIQIFRKDPCDRTVGEQNRINDYSHKGGRLFRMVKNGEEERALYVIPKSMRKSLVVKFHDLMGHFAVDRTVNKIKELYWSPSMKRYVRRHVA